MAESLTAAKSSRRASPDGTIHTIDWQPSSRCCSIFHSSGKGGSLRPRSIRYWQRSDQSPKKPNSSLLARWASVAVGSGGKWVWVKASGPAVGWIGACPWAHQGWWGADVGAVQGGL